MSLVIRDLRECPPSLLPLLADWFMDGFKGEGAVREEELLWLEHSVLSKNKLPITKVAFLDEKPVGTARIFHSEMPDRPEFDPWFGYSYVIPEIRSHGVGRALYEARRSFCLSQGIKHAFLYTSTQEQRFLARGWRVVERRIWLGNEVAIMDTKFP